MFLFFWDTFVLSTTYYFSRKLFVFLDKYGFEKMKNSFFFQFTLHAFGMFDMRLIYIYIYMKKKLSFSILIDLI
jgi:hypothetical protein